MAEPARLADGGGREERIAEEIAERLRRIVRGEDDPPRSIEAVYASVAPAYGMKVAGIASAWRRARKRSPKAGEYAELHRAAEAAIEARWGRPVSRTVEPDLRARIEARIAELAARDPRPLAREIEAAVVGEFGVGLDTVRKLLRGAGLAPPAGHGAPKARAGRKAILEEAKRLLASRKEYLSTAQLAMDVALSLRRKGKAPKGGRKLYGYDAVAKALGCEEMRAILRMRVPPVPSAPPMDRIRAAAEEEMRRLLLAGARALSPEDAARICAASGASPEWIRRRWAEMAAPGAAEGRGTAPREAGGPSPDGREVAVLEEIGRAFRENRALRAENASLREEVRRMREGLEALSERVRALEERDARREEELRAAREELRRSLESLEGAWFRNYGKEILDLQQRMRSADRELSALEEKAAGAAARAGAAEAAAAAAEAAAKRAEAEAAGLLERDLPRALREAAAEALGRDAERLLSLAESVRGIEERVSRVERELGPVRVIADWLTDAFGPAIAEHARRKGLR